MGFFDKVKSLKNAITGGGATVYFETGDVEFGTPFEVTINVKVGDSDIKISRVYFDIEGSERVEVTHRTSSNDSDGGYSSSSEKVKITTETYKEQINVAGDQLLSANESYEWKATVTLPDHLLPVYHGHNCQHTYIARASIDCFGNDPDSGWVTLNVR
jgi:hypothetical protein